jgi:hypothetical protein
MTPRLIWRVLLLIGSLAVPILAQEHADRSDAFAPIRFFVGTWSGDQVGEPGHGTAERTYALFASTKQASTFEGRQASESILQRASPERTNLAQAPRFFVPLGAHGRVEHRRNSRLGGSRA